MAWGDKGEEYAPDRCDHPKDDGCMWCCRACNYDRHMCPGCGTTTDHKETHCLECDHIHFPENHERNTNCKKCMKELDAKVKELISDYGYIVPNNAYVTYNMWIVEDKPTILSIEFVD